MTTRAAMVEAVRRAWEQCCQTATDPLSSIERRAFYTVQAALLDAAADALAAEDWRPIESAPEFEYVEVRCNDPLLGEYVATAQLTEGRSLTGDEHPMIWVDPGGDTFCKMGEDYITAWRPRTLAKRPLPAPPAREG